MGLNPEHWETLRQHGQRVRRLALREMVAADASRADRLAVRVGPIYASFARQHIDTDALGALFALAREADAAGALRRLFDGADVNLSEGRPALHTALRSDRGAGSVAAAARSAAAQARDQMDRVHDAIVGSGVTDVINVGIGGSDLGPRLAVDALRDFHDGRLRVHFLANVDGSAAQHLLGRLDPARTAAVLVSKSFGTQETLLNGAIVRDWLGGSDRLYAVSANLHKTAAFGIAPERVLPMWDWVGGR